MKAAGVLLLLGLLGHSPAASAQMREDTDAQLQMLFGEHLPYERFLTALQRAVHATDPEAVAKLVSYPLTTEIGGTSVTLASEADFVARYPQIFSPAVVAAVEAQSYENLFVNAEGVAIGAGLIWFRGICRAPECIATDVKIIAVNPP